MAKTAGTTIQPCTCEHKGQDELHGRGMRVHNVSDKDKLAYCTVCAANKQTTRNTTRIDPIPALGMLYAIPGRGPRIGKQPRF